MEYLWENIFDEVVCSIHPQWTGKHKWTGKHNVWDYLSAKGLQKIYNVPVVSFLHTLTMAQFSDRVKRIIYGWWGMLRPGFADRKVYSHFKSFSGNHSIVWVGINRDIWMPDFSQSDIEALRRWLDSSSYVSVRDDVSRDFIESKVYIWENEVNIHVEPCPSYIQLQRILKQSSNTPVQDKSIGIVPSFWHTKQYLPFVASTHELIQHTLWKYGQTNVLILCHDLQDYSYATKHFSHCEAVLISEFNDVITQYSRCEWIITTRAHGIVFSAAVRSRVSYTLLSDKMDSLHAYHFGKPLRSEVPNFDLSYHEKNLEVSVLMPDKGISRDNPLLKAMD